MIDPITAEIVVHAISAIPNLIDKNITKTAFSPLVSEHKDYAVGIVDADVARGRRELRLRLLEAVHVVLQPVGDALELTLVEAELLKHLVALLAVLLELLLAGLHGFRVLLVALP